MLSPHLHIQLFGDFHLVYNDQPVTSVDTPRLQALLVYLLLHRAAPQSRQHLAFTFWPDSTEAQARANLRQMLHYLRQALPAVQLFLQFEAKTVQWRATAPFTCDVAEFEHHLAQADSAERAEDRVAMRSALAGAIALYHGDLFPACYDDWILPEREQWREKFTKALEKLIHCLEEQRDYAAALHYAQRLLRHDPLHETTYCHLMRLHALNGDRANALRTYHTCVTVLQRELGVEPHPTTQAIYARWINAEQLPERASDVGLRAATPERLVGRQAEWGKLQMAWRSTMQGRAHFVFMAGEAGIGKSRLAEELLHWASQQGLTTAYTRSYAAEGDLAYAPVIEWLRSEALQAALTRLDTVWLTEVARLLPELLTQQPTLPRPEPLTERWQRQRLFEALARGFLLAKQPLLLVIDDLQWCDQETLEWLHYLLRFDPKARLLVIGAARPEEVEDSHPLTKLLLHLRSNGQVTEFELPRFTADEAKTLATQVAQHALDPQAITQLYQQTEGNPLFIVETVQAELIRGVEAVSSVVSFTADTATLLPPKVQAVLQARLSQLSPPARALAHLAAVIGRAFTFDELAQVGESDPETVVQALDELWQRRIIREHGVNAYDFSHDRIRDVAYVAISPARRHQLHRQIAVALEQHHTTMLDAVSAALAFHYEQAGMLEQALAYYQQAAQVAEALLAYNDATFALQHGLALLKLLPITLKTKTQELDILIALGNLLRSTKGFATQEVGETYHQALELCRQVGRKDQIYVVQKGLSLYHLNRNEFTLARQLAADNLLIVQELQNDENRQYAYECMGFVHLDTGEFVAALYHFEQALAIPLRQRTQNNQSEIEIEKTLLPVASGLCLWLLGYPDQARQRTQQTLTILQSHPAPIHIVGALEFALIGQHFLRNLEEMSTQAQEIVAIATKYDIPMYQAIGMIHMGFARSYAGETISGIAQLCQGLDFLKQTNTILYIPFCLALLSEAYRLAGQSVEGLVVIGEAISLAEQTGETWWQADLLRQQGELLLAAGAATSEVEECYQRAFQVARQQAAKSLELRAAMSLARLWQRQGKFTEAQALLEPIYNWFTEGFATVDLQAAKTLLDELSA